MSETVLRLGSVTKTYNTGKPNEIRVFDGVDLDLKRGELVALVAPSGAGKSTLLHIAGLLDEPDSGEIEIAGQVIGNMKDGPRTALRRDRVGFAYQFHHLLPEFSARENVMMPQLGASVHADVASKRAEELLSEVGLQSRMDHRPAELSGGEQQRVAVCRALANRPDLLLADEPTGNLDPETSDGVFEILLGLARETGLTALVATHNHDLAAKMDRIVRLENGKIV